MMNEIVLNGDKYISEKKVLEMLEEAHAEVSETLKEQIRAEERDKIKQLINKSIDNMYEIVEETVVKEPKAQPVQTTRYNTKDNNIYIVPKSMRKPYSKMHLQEDGAFLTKNNKAAKFTIYTVLGIKNRLNVNSTVAEVNKVADSLNIPYYTVGRLFYNVHQLNTFDKFLQEWEDLQAAEFFKAYKNSNKEPINNPEKRKEAGMYN